MHPMIGDGGISTDGGCAGGGVEKLPIKAAFEWDGGGS